MYFRTVCFQNKTDIWGILSYNISIIVSIFFNKKQNSFNDRETIVIKYLFFKQYFVSFIYSNSVKLYELWISRKQCKWNCNLLDLIRILYIVIYIKKFYTIKVVDIILYILRMVEFLLILPVSIHKIFLQNTTDLKSYHNFMTHKQML